MAAVDACSDCGVGCAAVLCKAGCGVEDEQECECVDDFFHKSVVGGCGVQGGNLMAELGLTKKTWQSSVDSVAGCAEDCQVLSVVAMSLFHYYDEVFAC